MSFGFAIGDFVALGNLAWNVYKECKSASAEFQEARNEVLSLHTAIRELQDEVDNKDSILNRAGVGRKQELDGLMRNCSDVLGQLEQLLTRYRSLGTKQKRTWDRVKFGSEGLQEIRSKLMFHTSALTLFLTSLGTGSLGRIEKKLDDLAAEIRAGQHEPSLISLCNEEDKPEQDSAWRVLIDELSEEFTRVEIEAHKDEIKRYIRDLLLRGDLDERCPSPELTEVYRTIAPSLASDPEEDPFTGAVPHRTRWPPQPSFESGSESSDSVLTERLAHDPTPSESDDSKLNSGNSDSRGKDIRTADECCEPELTLPQKPSVYTIEDLFPSCSPTKSTPGRLAYVGIDINFDYCRVAAYDTEALTSVVLSNEHGNRCTPTYVAFTPDDILIGEDAKNQASRNVENTFFGFTSLLGSLFDDKIAWTVKANSTFQLDNRNGRPAFFAPCRGKHYSPEELTAFLIKKLVHVAEVILGRAVSQIYIAAHGPLDFFRRQAYYEAAALAKVELLQRLRTRTTAAAFKYFVDQPPEDITDLGAVIVVDVRIDGCDCSILEFSEDVIEVSRTFGHFNSQLSLDVCLSRLLCSNFYANHPDIILPVTPRGMLRLTKAVEEARRQLFSAKKAELLIDSFVGGVDLNAQIDQTQIEDMVKRYLAPSLVESYERILNYTSTRAVKVTQLLVIGEMAKLLHVRNLIRRLSSDKFAAPAPVSQIDPLECTVFGITADHANVLGEGKSFKPILESISSNLSIATYSTDDEAESLTSIYKLGTHIPNYHRRDLFTMEDFQNGALLRILATKEFEIEEHRSCLEVAFLFSHDIQQLRAPYKLELRLDIGWFGDFKILVHGTKFHGSKDHDGIRETLLEMYRSSAGLLTVKRGTCVPITPHIRQNWRLTADETRYRIEGPTAEESREAAYRPETGHRRKDKAGGFTQETARERNQDKKQKDGSTISKKGIEESITAGGPLSIRLTSSLNLCTREAIA
ncbi:MAG: hypothetical protein Q9187_001072 [Circinaria calcarea]